VLERWRQRRRDPARWPGRSLAPRFGGRNAAPPAPWAAWKWGSTATVCYWFSVPWSGNCSLGRSSLGF